jgi:hypothetical protein
VEQNLHFGQQGGRRIGAGEEVGAHDRQPARQHPIHLQPNRLYGVCAVCAVCAVSVRAVVRAGCEPGVRARSSTQRRAHQRARASSSCLSLPHKLNFFKKNPSILMIIKIQ